MATTQTTSFFHDAANRMTKDLRLAFTKPNAAVLASPRTFQPYGQSGIEFSDYIPHIASCADDQPDAQAG